MVQGLAPKVHTQIRVNFVFDVKHDGRHKTRLVDDTCLTDVTLSSVYSGVFHFEASH